MADPDGIGGFPIDSRDRSRYSMLMASAMRYEKVPATKQLVFAHYTVQRNAVVTVVAYTSVTISRHGMGLLPIFFGDMASMTWPGQFNLDFFFLLLLAAIWIAWRHQFTATGLVLAVITPFGGMPFIATYLLVPSFKVGGSADALLLGEGRTAR